MTDTTNLTLPYLEAAQAQKHVTVNESLRRLDAVVQLSVVSATTTAQPGSPSDGAVYILPSGKTGAAWGSMANEALAYYRDGAWEQIPPREGWLAYVKDTDQLRTYTGSAWTQAASRAALGLGTAATANVGTSGATVPLHNTDNVWTGRQDFVTFSCFNALAGVNEKRWQLDGTTAYTLAAYSDDRASAASAFRVTRTGMTLGAFETFIPVQPFFDGFTPLGGASNRWSVVYSTTGAINTSDAREKTELTAIPDSVKRAVRKIMAGVGVFQWLASVAEKGEKRARLHVGVTAQAVRDAFEAEGEDAGRWALFCADPVETGERLGLRQDQMALLALAVLFAGR